jgi:organic hydroperoxide reductase OsmC/OhrA
VLSAAVGNCLSESLLYCLRRARIEVTALRAEVEVTPTRNDRGRLRIGAIRVTLVPEVAPGAEGRYARCLELFEDFCVVTESVRGGIDVTVDV